jgi:glycosyltransferase involved in cell wall biosynthesis
MHRANEGGNQALFLKGRKRVGADPIMGVIEIEAAVLEPPKPAEVIVDALFDHVSGLTQRGLDDDFADPRLVRRQTRSILAADALMAVSALWRENLIERFGREAELGGNGVDAFRYSPRADGSEAELRQRLGLGARRVFLCVGGIEARKNTTRILQAFVEIHRARPDARLVIAGGASLLDHHSYQAAFGRELTALREEASAVSLLGPVADSDMPGFAGWPTRSFLLRSRRASACACSRRWPAERWWWSRGFPLLSIISIRPTRSGAIRPSPRRSQQRCANRCARTLQARFARAARSSPQFGRREVAERHLPVYRRLREPVYA